MRRRTLGLALGLALLATAAHAANYTYQDVISVGTGNASITPNGQYYAQSAPGTPSGAAVTTGYTSLGNGLFLFTATRSTGDRGYYLHYSSASTASNPLAGSTVDGTQEPPNVALAGLAAPATSGGLHTIGSGAGQFTVDGAGHVNTNLQAIAGQAASAAGAVAFPTSIMPSGSVTVATNNDKAGYSLATAPPTASAIATAVRDVDNTSPAAGSLGAKVNAAASAGDPWATSLPGAYGAGTAGNILGNRLDAAISSRLATSGYTAAPTAATIAGSILATPGNLLATDATGRVTAGSVADKAGYSLAGSQTFSTSGAVGSVTGAVGSVTAPVTAGTVSDKAGYSLATAPPTAAAIATTILNDTTSSDQATSGSLGFLTKQLGSMINGTPAFTAPALALAPANSGGGSVTVAGYAAGQDPGTYVLATPANKLATNASGYVTATNGGGGGASSVVNTYPTGVGSTASAVTITGVPSGFNYVGQKLFNQRTSEARIIALQSAAGSTYTFTLGTGSGLNGPFSAAPIATPTADQFAIIP